ncbi:hypothetical protein GTW73_13850 [Streptomyces sp. SID4982]|nr:hypothetical protein [Streptomyces sp. SID4982]MYS15030.1 hypothetical protein [Streptomyces sp. SID4982]
MQYRAAWATNVIARYLTVAGATVDITDAGEETYWRYNLACTGCSKTGMDSDEFSIRRDAQSHAERCRAMPRPAASR